LAKVRIGTSGRSQRACAATIAPAESAYGSPSVFVVVAFVGGVPVSVVDVVQMVAVEDGSVAASVTVHVDVLLGKLVPW
jgi:hypothetical protein